jgi:mevalonate kinase
MSPNRAIKVSVPGSIMLLGEHAVLQNYPAVVGAVDRRIFAELIPRSDRKVFINSDRFGEFVTDIDLQVADTQKFRFILAALRAFKNKFLNGFDLKISSEFSDQVGLGSSAAVTVAVIAVVQQWIDEKIDLHAVYKTGVEVVHAVQGMGSGADIAASVFGGVVFYQLKPLKIEKLNFKPPLGLVYCGYKTPTVEVIKRVKNYQKRQPELLADLYVAIGKCTENGKSAIQARDWRSLGEIFNIHQGLLDALGVNDKTLSEIVYDLRKQSQVLGAKISGSGLGDCVVAVGSMIENVFDDDGVEKIDIKITEHGVMV